MKFIRAILTLFLLTIIFSPQVLSQSDGQRQEPGFNLNFNKVFDSYYYQDALSASLNQLLLSSNESFDASKYKLGPNDLITVTMQGPSNIVLRALVINSQGDIVLPMFGSVNILNQTISEAEQTINEVANNVFKNPQVQITLEKPRPLAVQVTGYIDFPGKHILPPFSRVDDAVFIASSEADMEKGYSESGALKKSISASLLSNQRLSLRNIQIKRKDGSIDSADLVAYFKAGKLDRNPSLQTGDHIIVGRKTNETPRISISGAVKNASEFEYSNNDTPELLIDIAGGFMADADTSKAYVYRHQAQSIEKIELKREQWQKFNLQPNDRFVIPTINKMNNNSSAWVYGEVQIPGNFPIKNGKTTALDLLNLAGNLSDRALPSAGYLLRQGTLENEIPNKFNSELMKRTSDQLQQGFEYLDLETRISQNKVFIDLNDNAQLAKVKIYDGDRLYVPRDEQTIFVFGQVNNPGYYPFTNLDQDVPDYISRAGGFALSANEDRIFIIKAGSGTWYKPEKTTLESGDRIFVDRVPFDELNAKRSYEVQKEQIKNTRIQLIMTGISTITGIITTYVAIQNIRNN